MYKSQPKNKICFQNKNNKRSLLNLKKLKKKKWFVFKKNIKQKKFFENKPEKLKDFYKKRLHTKQQLRYFYGCIQEYKIKNKYKFFKKNKKGYILSFLITHLESRLDTVIFRLGLAKSIFHAKQLISLGFIFVNNQKITFSNYELKKGDYIHSKSFFVQKRKIPKYLEINYRMKSAIFLKKPSFNDIKYPFYIKTDYINEYLSK